jgi:protein-tyrosine phosphatase
MIDLHTHVLPGIDDGPRTSAGSEELARSAAADGVTVLAATPHLRADHPGVVPAELGARCERLRGELHAAGIPVEVVPGGEVDIHWAQTPYGEIGDLFEELLFKLNARGFRTLLAHPERNPTFQREPERVCAFVERGNLMQVTALALAHAPRRTPERRLAEWLVRSSLAHVLASDAHRAGGHRGIGLTEAAAEADRLVPGAGRYLTEEAPAAILAGEEPGRPPTAPSTSAARRLFSRLARRRP